VHQHPERAKPRFSGSYPPATCFNTIKTTMCRACRPGNATFPSAVCRRSGVSFCSATRARLHPHTLKSLKLDVPASTRCFPPVPIGRNEPKLPRLPFCRPRVDASLAVPGRPAEVVNKMITADKAPIGPDTSSDNRDYLGRTKALHCSMRCAWAFACTMQRGMRM